MGTSKPEYERLGAKRLSLPDVIAQSVGFMGPVLSAAFLIPLVAGLISASGKGGGIASPLSVVIAAVGVFALISIAVVMVFFIVVIVKLGSGNSLRPFRPSSAGDDWSGIFFGVPYGVLLFVGFETAANLAEETPAPRRDIPIAVMTTAGIATVFFVLAAYVEVAGFHYSLRTLTAAAAAPLFALSGPASAGGYGGTWIDRLLELVVLFDMLAVAIGCSASPPPGSCARDTASSQLTDLKPSPTSITISTQ